MKQTTLERLNRQSHNSSVSAEDSCQILSSTATQAPDSKIFKFSQGAAEAPNSKPSSQSPFRQLRVLATLAQLKDDKIAYAAFPDPFAHPEYFEGILSKLSKLNYSFKLNSKFESSAKKLMAPFQNFKLPITSCKRSKLLCLQEDTGDAGSLDYVRQNLSKMASTLYSARW